MADRLDPDTAFRLLSNQRRRYVLGILAERDEEVSLQTLATVLAERLDESGDEDATYQSIYVSLYQNHVPRLADAGAVHYDEETRTVRIAHTATTRQLLTLLDAQPDRSWRGAYVALAAVLAVVAVGSLFGPLSVVGAAWVVPTTVLAVGLAVLGLWQYRTRQRIAVSEFDP